MMRHLRPATRLLWPIPALLLAAAPPAPAAEPASLEVTWGGGEGWLTPDRLRVLVDGAEVQVALPAAEAAPAATVHRGPIATGARAISVEAAMRGDSSIFTYVDGYRFLMRGHLDLQVVPGDAITVQADVVSVPGVTVQPEDRFRLALSARVRHAEGAHELAQASGDAGPPEPAPAPAAAPTAVMAAAPAAAPSHGPAAVATAVGVAAVARSGQEGAATPAPAPAPARAPAPAAAPATARATAGAGAATGACALAPVRFAFDSADLDPAAREALGRFAACLMRGSGRARLSGHWDAQGPLDYNVALGERRARAAAAFLVEAGLPAARVEAVRITETTDLCQEATRACRARNRRVEAVVLGEDRG